MKPIRRTFFDEIFGGYQDGFFEYDGEKLDFDPYH